jgi:hypothetical protein
MNKKNAPKSHRKAQRNYKKKERSGRMISSCSKKILAKSWRKSKRHKKYKSIFDRQKRKNKTNC